MSTDTSKTLPLLSLRNLVLFPGAVMPVEIGRASSLRLIEALGGKGARVLVGTQKDADIEEPAGADLYTICVEGEVVRIVKAAENRVTAVLRGIDRRRVTAFVQEKPYLLAAYEPLMMLKVLFYGYCIGIASSRRIEKATDETWRSGTWRPTSIPTTIPWRSFVADICRCWRLGLCRCSGWASRPGW